MATAFSRTMRALAADRFRRWLLTLLVVPALLGLWGAWFVLARVAVYAVTETARLEVDRAVHMVEAPVAGRVVATHLEVGRQVQAGEVLVEVDAEGERLHLEEARRRHAALSAQLEALRQQLRAEEEARQEAQQAAQAALEEAHARHHEAEVAARSAEEEAALFTRLQARRLAAKIDLMRARAKARQRRAVAETLRHAISRLEGEQRTRESDRQARLEGLEGEVTQLEGELATMPATIARLEHAIEQRHIRAPIAGRLGEVPDLQVGSVVRRGEALGAVVPPGDLKVVAHFPPAVALGRIRPGQSARLRLQGFPWSQYGSIAATVTRVASEARDGRLQVDLLPGLDVTSPIPLQHGLPGTVEVEVERVSPATLILRAAGERLGVAADPLEGGPGTGMVP